MLLFTLPYDGQIGSYQWNDYSAVGRSFLEQVDRLKAAFLSGLFEGFNSL
jgi:hypothetical protein